MILGTLSIGSGYLGGGTIFLGGTQPVPPILEQPGVSLRGGGSFIGVPSRNKPVSYSKAQEEEELRLLGVLD